MKIKKQLFLLFALIIQASGATSSEPPTVTIWIHGTKLTPTIVYKKFFYRKIGLHPATSYDPKYHKRTIANLLTETDPEHYSLDHFYFFGWNGRLSFNERKNAAHDLYEAMQPVIKAFHKQYGQMPKLRIITHSHGGNVALNMAKILQSAEISIDELILLACPVQEKTKRYITADCFKKVYAFYSERDMFQVIDPQGLYKKAKAKKTFSERTFEHHEKLRQAVITLNRRSLMHIDFLFTHFISLLPLLCKEADLFYETIIADQKHVKKIIEVNTKEEPIRFTKKLKP